MIGTPRTREILQVVAKIKPLLAGRKPETQGAVLAELLALWLPGFAGPDDETTADLRTELLAVHLAHFLDLFVINCRLLGTPTVEPRIPSAVHVEGIREAQRPGFWANETSGVLRPAVEAFLKGDDLSGQQLAALRAYFRQWIASPNFVGDEIEGLRLAVDGCVSRRAIEIWLDMALAAGIDPL